MANKPAGSILMLDEAYMHISPNPQFNSALVAADKDIVILRTFSKIYGMAGLRAGAVLARPDLIGKLDRFSNNGMLPITGMAAASASLQAKGLVEERRRDRWAIRARRMSSRIWRKRSFATHRRSRIASWWIPAGRRGK